MITDVRKYNPTFAWTQSETPPTVKNIEAAYAIMAKCCFVEARYIIENLGNPTSSEDLTITLPSGIKPAFSNVCMISRYQTISDLPNIGIRMDHANNLLYTVLGIGGNYASAIIPTGLQGFSAMFLIE